MLDETSLRGRRRLAQKYLIGPAAKSATLVMPEVPARGPLRWFWLDGLAFNIYDSMVLTFIPLYALALGATASEIGWMSAFGSLLGTAVLLPGARLAEWWGAPQRLVVWAGLMARLALLAMVLWPFTGQAGVWGIIVCATLRTMGNQIAIPAWTSIAADIVPEGERGRYFASRNLVMALGAAVALPLAGQIINGIGGPMGYRVDFALAFVIGLASCYFYARIQVPPREEPVEVQGKRLPLWERLRQHPTFLWFCVHAAIWNFSLQIAAPFFNVYLVQVVGASTVAIGLLTTVSTLSSLPGQQFWGRISDRVGSHRALLASGALIPLAPLAWMLVTTPWHVVPINLLSGFLWAGFNLATFNFLLATTPSERRPRYVALYNTVVGLANAGGAALGGWVADNLSYQSVFFLSGVGRTVAILLFFALVLRPSLSGLRRTRLAQHS